MELITFYTDDADEIIENYWTILMGDGKNNYKQLENLISDSFNKIKDVSTSVWNHFDSNHHFAFEDSNIQIVKFHVKIVQKK